jgi:glyoxylase-like metal-dependent hydrolase (beta-lactamase superfamily II)
MNGRTVNRPPDGTRGRSAVWDVGSRRLGYTIRRRIAALDPIEDNEEMARLTFEDGGPVRIAGTIVEGEQIAGFCVIHIPGHAPGQIALFRAVDRLLIAADAIYTLDAETGQPASARVPHPFSNWNTEMARESIRRLIPLGASSVWAGHV